MRRFPRLGPVNAALVSLYFALIWGSEGLQALISPYSGFEDPLHATAAAYFRGLFNFGLDGLIRTANVLAGVKFVMAIAFVAYLIDFGRALVMRREPNRETLDVVLLLASCTLMLWAWPALGSGDGGLIRVHATQFLLLTGAMIVIMVERHLDEREPTPSRSTTRARELAQERRALAPDGLVPIGDARRS
jgi:hypothetical protein